MWSLVLPKVESVQLHDRYIVDVPERLRSCDDLDSTECVVLNGGIAMLKIS